MSARSRIAPRLLSRAELRTYLGGIEDAEIDRRMARHQLPGPMWGSRPGDKAARWDRLAVDRALDRASDISRSVEASTEALDAALFGQA